MVNRSVMYEELRPGQERTLSIWDKCQYLITYCCSLVSGISQDDKERRIESIADIGFVCDKGRVPVEMKLILDEQLRSCSLIEAALIDMQGRYQPIELNNEVLSSIEQRISALNAGNYILVSYGCGQIGKFKVSIVK